MRRQPVVGTSFRQPSGPLSAVLCVIVGCGAVTLAAPGSAAGDAAIGLSVNDRVCSAAAPPFLRRMGPTGVVVKAHLSKPDEDATTDFAVWPVDRPAERTEWSSAARYPAEVAWGDVPATVLRDGGSYVVAARFRHGDQPSPWSAGCDFTVDFVRPDRPALISSVDYPTASPPGTGGAGVPGTFTLSADGVADAIGFQYGLAGVTRFVAADQPGGAATIRLTPFRSGPQRLSVDIIDRAGNRSNTAVYDFHVAGTEPTISDAEPMAWAGDPHHLTLRANVPDVASFTYRVDGEAPRTVPAEPDGTAGVTVVPPRASSGIRVFSTTRAGARSAPAWMLLFADTRPSVTSAEFPLDGTPGAPVGTVGTFTLRPHMHRVVAYVYQFDRGEVDEQPPRVVPAAGDGTASLTFTPARAGTHLLRVWSISAGRPPSAATTVTFFPTATTPPAAAPPIPAPASPSPRADTRCGVSFNLELPGEDRAQQLTRVEGYYQGLEVLRLFYPADPAPWAEALDSGRRSVAVSFKFPPQEILAGRHDAYLRTWFATAPRTKDVFWTFHHEPEKELREGDFTFAEFRAAWTRLRALADTARNPRLHATLILTGFTASPTSGRNWHDYYPGRDVIDVLGWDIYSHAARQGGRYTPGPQLYANIVRASQSVRSPFAVAETGSILATGDDGTQRAAWLRSAVEYLSAQGALFVSYFDVDFSQNAGAPALNDFRLRDAYDLTAWHEFCTR